MYKKDPMEKTGAPVDLEPAPVNPPDTHIWGVYGCLVVLSIIELYSASSFEIATQGLYSPLVRHVSMLLMGLVIILGLQRVHYKWFTTATTVVAVLSVVAMVYVMFFGEYVNGARRAIDLGFMKLQPAEFIKLSAVLVPAMILGTSALKKDEGVRNRALIKTAAIVLLMGALLFTQGLTNTLIMMAVSVSMLMIGSLEWKKFFIVLAVYGLAAVGAGGIKMAMSNHAAQQPVEEVTLVDSHGRTYAIPEAAGAGGGESSRLRDNTWQHRIMSFFGSGKPKYEESINAGNLQEQRSYMAQAHGGLFGVFPGNSRETSRLPLAFSDYIYAIIVEDLGLIGGIAVMILYLWLLARAYVIAQRCNHLYPALLVSGCAVLITAQALCHMAIVTGAAPVSGQPLPLFSKGGTSILVTSIAFGIMLSVSRYSVRKKDASAREIRAEVEALPEELRAANPSQL